jgi:hypothetical protein
MWPEKVLRQFHTVPANCKEPDFCGPYNKLLNYYFPPTSDFAVVPRNLKATFSDSTDYIACFEIQNEPVLIVMLKDPAAIQSISTRAEANDQIRRRIIDLAERCPLGTLHAISAIGTKPRFYSLSVKNRAARIDPPRIDRDPDMVNDCAPAERWNFGGERREKVIGCD